MSPVVLAWLPLALWAAGVLTVGALEINTPSLPAGSDKLAHFVMYGIGGALAAWAERRRGGGAGWIGLGFVACVAAADELRQGTIPGRDSDVWDWVADGAGAVVFYTVAKSLLRRRGVG